MWIQGWTNCTPENVQRATPALITIGSVNIKIDILAERSWRRGHGLDCSWSHLKCQHETIASIVQISTRIICLFLKLLCWKAFPEADETSVTALADLGNITQPTAKTAAGIEKLVCLLYQPKTLISNVKDQCNPPSN